MKTRTVELSREGEYAGVLVLTDGAPIPDMFDPALKEEVERVIQETGTVEVIAAYRVPGVPPPATPHYHDERWLQEVFSNLEKKGYTLKITEREDGGPG